MSTIAWFILGGVGASVLWVFVLAWFIDIISAQRKALDASLTTTRLYRETRDYSNAQVRDLLDQNERLARQLIDRAAESATSPILAIPQSFFHATRES
jgi:hypothetical protein